MTVGLTFTKSARRVGIVAASGTAFLGAVYVATLIAGLLSLRSLQQPIPDPLFSFLEIEILLLMPLFVALMVSVHAWAGAGAKVFSLMALVFAGVLAGLTSALHFVILIVGHQAAFSKLSPLLLSFKWPSVAYAIDILGWDIFFALSVLSAAPVFSGGRLATTIRVLLATSGTLALAGLSGVVLGDMRFRNIGIVGYAGVFPSTAVLLAILFQQSPPQNACQAERPVVS
ncbi:hypothetical protein [Sphingomonas sp. TF3]|uniref:hypothetical protein n=2 Tax=Pseudomonadota TaxID=1224 RepID=UPI00163C4EA5|nr:hypothetical protein [Sphingomonas sp. TF3]